MKIIKTSIVLFFVVFISMVSCKSEDTNPVYEGEFIHVDSAAVLKGGSFIYGVKMDEISKQLISQVNELKADEYDIINVVVKGELNPNPGEGWPEILTITTIEEVQQPIPTQEENVLQYSSQKSE